MSFSDITSQFADLKSLVIGDIMLDTHYRGSTNRISPEAPVPVLAIEHIEHKAGGAGNVASNLMALGSSVSLHAVWGSDAHSQTLKTILEQQGISSQNIYTSIHRKTTQKIRLLNGNTHLLRCDLEDTFDLNAEESSGFLKNLQNDWDHFHPDLIFLQDYDKGVCTPEIIQYSIQRANLEGIPVVVDPKKNHFFHYRNCTLFKPNFKEVCEALEIDSGIEKSMQNLTHLSSKLLQTLPCKNLLITLSEKGIFFSNASLESGTLPAFKRNIIDVSGAGDTVLAVAGLCLALDKSLAEVAWYANLAGGLACEYSGVQALDAAAFSKAIRDCA